VRVRPAVPAVPRLQAGHVPPLSDRFPAKSTCKGSDVVFCPGGPRAPGNTQLTRKTSHSDAPNNMPGGRDAEAEQFGRTYYFGLSLPPAVTRRPWADGAQAFPRH
jgi:hypothetical protein